MKNGVIKKLFWRVGIAVLFWGVVISVLGYINFCSYEVTNVMESPDGKYAVNISQKRALNGGRDFYIDAKNSSGDEVVFDRDLILSVEWMDTGFRGYYPNFHWLAPNVLRLGTFGERQDGLVKINNSTEVKIKYLRMALPDAYMRTEYIMFDIKPHSQIVVRGEPNNFCWIAGEFANGKQFYGTFDYSAEGEKRSALRVFVQDRGIKFRTE